MSRLIFTIFSVLSAVFILLPAFPGAAGARELRASWYFLRSDTDNKVREADIRGIAETGFTHILIPAVVTQEKAASTQVLPPGEEYLDSLAHGIDTAHGNGLKVALTGFLLVGDGSWRGLILPTARKKWAVSYMEAISPIVKLAADKGVALFCFASEMESLKSESKIWEYILFKTREMYTGKIGFNVNWWYNRDGFEFIRDEMRWMEKLDFVGVSSYFQLTDKTDPAAGELAKAWELDRHGQNVVEQMNELKRIFPKQQIFVWELGYRSVDGTNTDPANFRREGGPDPGEQADCFEAFLGIFPRTGLDGFAIWDQYPGFSQGGPSEKGYDFIGKPAEDVIRKYLAGKERGAGMQGEKNGPGGG